MTKLDRLLAELCPDGVENAKLEEVIISLKTGLNPRKNFILNANDAKNFYVTVREIVDGKIVFFDKTDRVNDEALALISNRSNLEAGDVLFSGTGTVGRIAVVEETPYNWNIKEGVYVIKPKQDIITSKFLAYLLGSSSIIDIYKVKIVGSPVCSLPMADLRKLVIPLPPLPVQHEIVRILDNFTELTAKLTVELTAELTARKKQYEYYRDKLLTFGDDVPMVMLEEVAKISNGKDHKSLSDGDTPVYGSGGIMRYANQHIYDKPSVLIPRKGSINNIFYIDIPFWTVDTIFYTKIDCIRIIPKFLYYYLLTQHLEDLNTAGGVPSLTKAVLDRVKIPLPSLTEQARIVDILDRFDTLTNDITSGLPAEIALRKKQYEYYRDKLLNFKEIK